MKVLLCLCACVAAAAAHGVVYPVEPFGYHSTYTVVGYPLPYLAYNLVPNNLVLTGFPGLVHYVPLAPAGGKGKPEKKKPGEQEEKEKKEETTEEAKKEDEEKADEPEDLAR